MTRIVAVARACLLELSRRRGVIALLVALPLVFYLARRDLAGQSIRMLALGLGWTVSTLALFVAVSAKDFDRRLRLAGYAAWQLVLGRVLAVTALGLLLATGYAALILVDQDVDRLWAVLLLLVTTTLVAAPLGAVCAAVLPRELEGTLALLAIFAMQMLADPASSLARVLPYWSTRELGTYAIDGTAGDYLVRGLVHFGITGLLLTAAAVLVSVVRLRLQPASLPQVAADTRRQV